MRLAPGESAARQGRARLRLPLRDAAGPRQRDVDGARVFRRWYARSGVLIRRAGGVAPYRRDDPWAAYAPAGRGGRDHRGVRWQLHRTCLRSLWRAPFRRVRQTLPQAQRAGGADRPNAQPGQLVRAVVGGLRSLGDGCSALRRDPVRECDVRRPREASGPVDHRHRDRHLDRYAPRLRAGRTGT